MNHQEFHALLNAYERGRSDGLKDGSYNNLYHNKPGMQGSAYKAGYDRGISEHCDSEGLNEEEHVSMVYTHTFNASFAASMLSASIESAGTVNTSERIAAAAMGIADAEADVDWGDVNYDDVIAKVAEAVEASSQSNEMVTDNVLKKLRNEAAEIVRKESM